MGDFEWKLSVRSQGHYPWTEENEEWEQRYSERNK